MTVRRSVLLKLFDRQNGRCCYCGGFVVISADRDMQRRLDAATVEHLRRRAEGGTYHIANLACACRRCNHGRGDIDWLTYATFRRGEFIEFMAATGRRQFLLAVFVATFRWAFAGGAVLAAPAFLFSHQASAVTTCAYTSSALAALVSGTFVSSVF